MASSGKVIGVATISCNAGTEASTATNNNYTGVGVIPQLGALPDPFGIANFTAATGAGMTDDETPKEGTLGEGGGGGVAEKEG